MNYSTKVYIKTYECSLNNFFHPYSILSLGIPINALPLFFNIYEHQYLMKPTENKFYCLIIYVP